MPPRRSCFQRDQSDPIQQRDSFNATTAFLLQVRENTISRPIVGFNATAAFLLRMRLPSWSSGAQCFNATTAFLLPGQFPPFLLSAYVVSMPPRRSCFAPIHPSAREAGPVSMPPRRSCFSRTVGEDPPELPRFNATTAFLLPGQELNLFPRIIPRFQCHHGVPASPSFGSWAYLGGGSFNATTAFLLHWTDK